MRIMTPTEEKNILSSLNFNVEEYIRKNGLVTEKNRAIELLCEIVFSPIGYRLTSAWKREEVGKEYFDYIKKEEDEACES